MTENAKETLRNAEETFDFNYPYVEASINNLALLYSTQGNISKLMHFTSGH